MGTESQVTLTLGGLHISLAGRPWLSLSLLQLCPGECGGWEWLGCSDLSCLIHAVGGPEAVRIEIDCTGLVCMRPEGGALAKEKQQAQYWEAGIVKPSLTPLQIRCATPQQPPTQLHPP